MLAALLIALTATVRIGWDAPSDTPGVRLSGVPNGVIHRDVHGIDVFIVSDERRVDAFVARSTYSQKPLRWCVRERVFLDPATGSSWDGLGRVSGLGPAVRSLDRFEAERAGDDVVVVRPADLKRGPVAAPRSIERIRLGLCREHVP